MLYPQPIAVAFLNLWLLLSLKPVSVFVFHMSRLTHIVSQFFTALYINKSLKTPQMSSLLMVGMMSPYRSVRHC
ncbi:uncharacterized protein CCOS01_04999 [Colletotrichum costaricense]|uniref:Uncharacterized protein n=1 Tax=Colletotrichum costaricense TaxID=1209916 RepID=A0AAJ0E4Z0_9PEZI|nr:uncharacterized protein CCOS01_04999 [Colletotrichum costaricense]KAK1533016.1 hypothetical protein CCOS01_04999 [Colletotrichum costaricense]